MLLHLNSFHISQSCVFQIINSYPWYIFLPFIHLTWFVPAPAPAIYSICIFHLHFCSPDAIPISFHFGSSFLSISCSILGSISGPKLVQKLFCFGSIFQTLSFEVLKLFKCLLRAFLNLSYSSWEPPRREKYGFPMVKSHFLKMMHFGTLRFIMPSLESSWCILANYDPRTHPKTDPKMDPKWTQNETKICSIFGPIFK